MLSLFFYFGDHVYLGTYENIVYVDLKKIVDFIKINCHHQALYDMTFDDLVNYCKGYSKQKYDLPYILDETKQEAYFVLCEHNLNEIVDFHKGKKLTFKQILFLRD